MYNPTAKETSHRAKTVQSPQVKWVLVSETNCASFPLQMQHAFKIRYFLPLLEHPGWLWVSPNLLCLQQALHTSAAPLHDLIASSSSFVGLIFEAPAPLMFFLSWATASAKQECATGCTFCKAWDRNWKWTCITVKKHRPSTCGRQTNQFQTHRRAHGRFPSSFLFGVWGKELC